MEITKGVIKGAQKVVIYGPEGIGKSHLASQFPNPVFIDTEGSTKHMDVARLPNPSSWTMLLNAVQHVKAYPTICDTLVIDTVDWAERLCASDICATGKKDSIKDFGYQGGYIKLAEEIGRLLNLLNDIIDLGINVVLVAHAQMRKFEQPDEIGAYDRWELKLEKRVSPLIKEWADMILFCNYKTYVVNVDGQGATKGTNKVQGGMRVMHSTHHNCWDAKNRHGLKEELELYYGEIAHCIPARGTVSEPVAVPQPEPNQEPPVVNKPAPEPEPEPMPNIPKALVDLMEQNVVTVREIQEIVAKKGYYPVDTPIDRYDPNFINGVLVGAWTQVFGAIMENREIPY